MQFYFYDLETTGLDVFKDRIMQFGGQSLDADLNPLAEVDQFYVQLSEDVIPSPGAIVTHKILPQQANLEGLTEYQFLNWLDKNVYQKQRVYGGYNIANFDNQFMRWLHWRNFAQPAPMIAPSASLDIYKILRLTADLRPQGINWPRKKDNSPSLTLSALTQANQLQHQAAHSAAGDVTATVALARLLKKAQPKLFNHCLRLLQPSFVKAIVNLPTSLFLYNSYQNLAFGSSTTIAVVLAEHPTKVGCLIVYDLRQPVDVWQKMNAYELSLRLQNPNSSETATPFSVLDINQAPLVAPLSVLNQDLAQRLQLNKKQIEANWQSLQKSQLATKITQAYLKLVEQSLKKSTWQKSLTASPLSENDQSKWQKVRQTSADEIAHLNLQFDDSRLQRLRFLYQARNFPKHL